MFVHYIAYTDLSPPLHLPSASAVEEEGSAALSSPPKQLRYIRSLDYVPSKGDEGSTPVPCKFAGDLNSARLTARDSRLTSHHHD